MDLVVGCERKLPTHEISIFIPQIIAHSLISHLSTSPRIDLVNVKIADFAQDVNDLLSQGCVLVADLVVEASRRLRGAASSDLARPAIVMYQQLGLVIEHRQ